MGAGISHARASDKDLVDAYLQGDESAFAHIVERHRTHMAAIAKRYARNEYDAQDIMQDALFKASRNMHTYRSEAALSTWLHRLVSNAAFDHAKRPENRQQHASLDDEENTPLQSNPALAHDPLAGLDGVLAIRRLLNALPAAQRRAVWLTDVAGLSITHAARELGVKPGTVKSRRHRAREVLLEMAAEGRFAELGG